MAQSGGGIRVGVDTGGTFTDLALRTADGAITVGKVPSIPVDPHLAVLTGLRHLLDRGGLSLSELTALLHGTTVATNAFLTRSGAKVGLVTTQGFRDVLGIGYQTRESLYDPSARRSEPLVARSDIWEIDERVDAEGSEVIPLNSVSVTQLADRMRERRYDVVVVAFLNAYVNPAHELQCSRVLSDRGVAEVVLPATGVCNEMREYDRTSTAVLNAYVLPVVAKYLGRLENELTEAGMKVPLWIMQSNGGLTDARTASTQSAKTILSGLAGGIAHASQIAKIARCDRSISLDVGGTSTDVALITGGQPDMRTSGEIHGYPLRIPSLDVHTIGAGGGSIAWLDSGGALRVGPASVGADPGPACYDRGGLEFTVTDAHLVLGRLGRTLADGAIKLSPTNAKQALHRLAERSGLPSDRTASGVLQVATASMARGIRAVSVERGIDVRECTLIAFGGAGPLHAADLLRELGMSHAVIPPHPGVAAALGLLDAPFRHDYAETVSSQTRRHTLSEAVAYCTRVLTRLKRQVEEAIGSDQETSSRFELAVDCRYSGQSHELTIPWAADPLELQERFHAAHLERFGFQNPESTLEFVTVRVSVIQQDDRIARNVNRNISPVVAPDYSPPRREVYMNHDWLDVPIWKRSQLVEGKEYIGPLIVEQLDSTTIVLPSQSLISDTNGFLHIREM